MIVAEREGAASLAFRTRVVHRLIRQRRTGLYLANPSETDLQTSLSLSFP